MRFTDATMYSMPHDATKCVWSRILIIIILILILIPILILLKIIQFNSTLFNSFKLKRSVLPTGHATILMKNRGKLVYSDGSICNIVTPIDALKLGYENEICRVFGDCKVYRWFLSLSTVFYSFSIFLMSCLILWCRVMFIGVMAELDCMYFRCLYYSERVSVTLAINQWFLSAFWKYHIFLKKYDPVTIEITNK